MKQLSRQTELYRDNCTTCPHMNAHTVTVCAGCPAFAELNIIGNWLLADSANRKGRDVQINKPGPVVSSRTMTTEKLSIIDYTNLKSERVSDAEIVKNLGVSLSSFERWKRKNGLTKRGLTNES